MSMRSYYELKACNYAAMFITLTYNPENEPTLINKRDVQLFLKRLRQHYVREYLRQFPKKERQYRIKYAPKFRYLICAEYGERTLRPHYHGILFGIPKTDQSEVHVTNAWQKGFVHVGTVTKASIHYVSKYLLKHYASVDYTKDTPSNGFYMLSKSPIYGYKYIEEYAEYHKENQDKCAAYYNGYFISLPQNFKRKIGIIPNYWYIDERNISFANKVEHQARFERKEHTKRKVQEQKQLIKLESIKCNENF